MKKRLLSGLVAWCVFLAGIPVFAAEKTNVITIEGEDYTAASASFTVKSDPEFSKGAYLYIREVPAAHDYVISYTFDVERAGLYEISTVATILNQPYTSDWTAYVNTPENSPKEYIKTEDIAVSWDKNLFRRYSLGTFRLAKGENTLYIQLDKNDLQSNGHVLAYFDYFTIAKPTINECLVEFDGSDIGTFSEDSAVSANLTFTAPDPAAVKYDFLVEDMYHREVKRDTLTTTKGGDSYRLYLGRFVPGWYRLYIYRHNTQTPINTYTAFAVTVSPQAREKFDDTAFAADFAGDMDTGSISRAQSFARAFQLAGITWTRERGVSRTKVDQNIALKAAVSNAGVSAVEVPDGNSVSIVSSTDWQGLGDLYQTAYLSWKGYPATNKGYTDMFEVFNEQDLGSVPADIYSAYFKAAAIGLADSPERPYVSATGLAMYTGLYFDLLSQNQVWRYSDIYNFHAHEQLDNRAEWARQYSNAYAEGEPLPLYLTEAGIHQIPPEGGVLSDEQMAESARFAITSTVSSLAHGTDKHFWFLFRPYIENNGNFSCFHANSYYPYPAYAALSNMTYRLGEGLYSGILCNLPDGATGYLFDDGTGRDIAVIWAEDKCEVTFQANKLTWSDMLGYEEERTSQTGEITLNIWKDPIFVMFEEPCNTADYYPVDYRKNVVEHNTFTVNERVVLQPIWEGFTLPDASIKANGYKLDKDEVQTVSVRVYNLNPTAVFGTLRVASDNDRFAVDIKTPEFQLGPWASTTIDVKLKRANEMKEILGGNEKVKFYGELSDGSALSPAVSAYTFKVDGGALSDEDTTLFEGFTDPDNYDLTNVGASGTIEMTDNNDGSYTLKTTFSNLSETNCFSFPIFPIADTSVLQGSDGMVFDRICAEDSTAEKTSMFVYMKDGRYYYSGDAYAVPFSKEWERLVFPWDRFTLFSSPLGNVDIREFSIDDIASVAIGIGGNSNHVHPAYTIKNFGYYKTEQQVGTGNEIVISGVKAGKTYPNMNNISLVATLPDETITNVRVLNHASLYENWKQNGKQVTVDVSALPRGYYKFQICAENAMGYVHTAVIDFYVEGE